MFRRLLIVLIYLINITVYAQDINACTAFCLSDNKNYTVVGKNLDWVIGDGYIMINPRNIEKSSTVIGNYEFKWKSKYGSVTFNQLGLGHPLGGMNERGLVVEELSHSPSIYSKHNHGNRLNELQWIQYQLDNYTTVEEVVEHINEIQIEKLLIGLHYFISDKSGNSAVVEFLNGELSIYHNNELKYPVLSNNNYQNSLRYLCMHKGFGGDNPIRDSRDSQSRFVKTTKLIQDYIKDHPIDPLEYAFFILNEVKQIDTQWSIVYDPFNMMLNYKTKDSLILKSIKMDDICFSTHKILFRDINDSYKTDFKQLEVNSNNILLESVFDQLEDSNIIDENTLSIIKETLMSCHNNTDKGTQSEN